MILSSGLAWYRIATDTPPKNALLLRYLNRRQTHKGRSSSLSSLWKPIKKDGQRNDQGGKGHFRGYSEIQHITAPLPPGTAKGSAFPDQEESIPPAGTTYEEAAGHAAYNAAPAVSPSSSEKKRNQYSLRRIFLHRKTSSGHEPTRSASEGLSPSISAPWGLTVASFRPAAVVDTAAPQITESTPDFRQLNLENSILVSRESDSNGLLAQSRARDMPVPGIPVPSASPFTGIRMERSKSLGQYMPVMEHPASAPMAATLGYKSRRYDASTLCEKFVLPRPRLVALTITPPSSPPKQPSKESETTYSSRPESHVIGRRASQLLDALVDDNRGPSPALSGHRVLREGVQRDRERETWAAQARNSSGHALRMRLPSVGKTAHQDRKYQLARFAPQPVAYEPVFGLDASSEKSRRVRKHERSESLGNDIVRPYTTQAAGETIDPTMDFRSSGMDNGSAANPGQRRASESASSRRTATATFLRYLSQTRRSRKPSKDLYRPMPIAVEAPDRYVPARKSSLPAPASPSFELHRDKPLPPEPESNKRLSGLRHSVSTPDLRTTSEMALSPDDEAAGDDIVRSPPQSPYRDSTLNLFSDSSVAGRLAHHLGADPSESIGSGAPSSPAPLENLEDASRQAFEPFTPTRQAAWDQWHRMQPRSPSSPVPERLPLDTVLALASRQLTSPRQKRPSMEEAVNRARIANQLFGEPDHQSSSGSWPALRAVEGEAAQTPRNSRFDPSAIGSPNDDSQYVVRPFSPRTPRTAQLLAGTPGSTEPSPMPGASFDDIERDLFFSRPRRLWGSPVVLPSRETGHSHAFGSNSSAGPRQSKDSGGSMSTGMVLTSDDASQDAQNLELATPNLSQNGHNKSRFPAISEEDRFSDKGHLPRDASNNTTLNFNQVETRQTGDIQADEQPGFICRGTHRSSVSAEYGLLESPPEALPTSNGRHSTYDPSSTLIGSSPPVYLTLPSFIRQESDISSDSYAASFATAQFSETVKGTSKVPDFFRQNTETTTMSYATADGDVL
ncbi:hypothetical protein NCC49_005056 [Naganishia albida]|nr:hypothetical protein NCC49_005056 [Naganishia albida]